MSEVPLLQVLAPDIPDRVGSVDGAVLQSDLELAIDCRVDQRVEVGEVGNPTCDCVIAGIGGILHATLGLRRPGLSLPVGVGGIGLPIGPALIDGIPDDVTHGIAIALNFPVDHLGVDVCLADQAGLEIPRAAIALSDATIASGLLVHNNHERSVGPTLDELPVDQIMVEHDLAPAKCQSGIGARAKVQPVISLGTQVGLARVDGNICVGGTGNVGNHAGGVVVVRNRLLGCPLHEHGAVGIDVAPRPGFNVVEGGREMARAFANLIGGHDIG